MLDDPFVVVSEGDTFEEASMRAAEAALTEFADIAEYETSETFWDGERGAIQLAALYGDHHASLVDKDKYTVISV
ncbi:hypothetical protein [Streptomyces sp. NPDC052127]|uniref:hypothetical protein n=1 Tax=Streptomyces sp. NPDC052127 TaxID=3155679 RepID=UPI0034368407